VGRAWRQSAVRGVLASEACHPYAVAGERRLRGGLPLPRSGADAGQGGRRGGWARALS
jgi:hypothetical protein